MHLPSSHLGTEHGFTGQSADALHSSFEQALIIKITRITKDANNNLFCFILINLFCVLINSYQGYINRLWKLIFRKPFKLILNFWTQSKNPRILEASRRSPVQIWLGPFFIKFFIPIRYFNSIKFKKQA